MSERPPFDEALAADLVGKLVLLGMTYEKPGGDLIRRLETFGYVTSATHEHGIAIEVLGEVWKGQTITLPPTTDSFIKASPGQYRLRSTGEVVDNPDYTCAWTVIERADS